MSWLSAFTGVQWMNVLVFVLASAGMAGWWKPLVSAETAVFIGGALLWGVSVINYVMALAGKKALSDTAVKAGSL